MKQSLSSKIPNLAMGLFLITVFIFIGNSHSSQTDDGLSYYKSRIILFAAYYQDKPLSP